MIRVSMEVRSGVSRFKVAVRAQSIRRALSIVGNRYPQGSVRVQFPLDPESSFVKDLAARAGLIGVEPPERMAA